MEFLLQKTQTEKSFYQTGGNLPLDAPSYIKRKADDELYEALVRGEFCYVLNSRQMGKSSLMVRTAEKLKAEALETVDLQSINGRPTPILQRTREYAA